jgi:hypothetical protein
VGPEDEAPAEDLGFGFVTGGGDEAGEELVGDRIAVDEEGSERDLADGAFAVGGEGVFVVRAHEERAAFKADHAGEGLGFGLAGCCG